ncbi:hypothetical protein HGM15179_019269, partial [Zosterops borbonicus]
MATAGDTRVPTAAGTAQREGGGDVQEELAPDVLSLFVLPAPALPAGVLVPVPGPALCAAAAGLAGAVPVPYPLEPARGWAPDVAALRRAVRGARGRCRPRVLWVLNPGDPTGHVLSGALMRSLLAVAAEEELLLLADE